MKQRVYLDTSVISALGDLRAPDRQELTREFFDRLSTFESAASDITRIEIERTRDASRRTEMLAILSRCNHILPSSPEAESLASNYLAAAIFPSSVPEDALHVAIAVLNRQDVIVSWNFKHLVNQRRRAAIDALNLSIGLPPIIILAPPEV
jgi:predicted nucleic acid-binding protein